MALFLLIGMALPFLLTSSVKAEMSLKEYSRTCIKRIGPMPKIDCNSPEYKTSKPIGIDGKPIGESDVNCLNPSLALTRSNQCSKVTRFHSTVDLEEKYAYAVICRKFGDGSSWNAQVIGHNFEDPYDTTTCFWDGTASLSKSLPSPCDSEGTRNEVVGKWRTPKRTFEYGQCLGCHSSHPYIMDNFVRSFGDDAFNELFKMVKLP